MSSIRAEEHLPLAAWVVYDVTRHMPPADRGILEDLVSVATVALVEVAGRYDPTGGATFATYARQRIRGAVLDELRRTDWASRSVRDGRSRLAKADAALHMELDRKPTLAELAARLELSIGDLEQLRADVHRSLLLDLDGIVNEHGQPLDVPADAPGPEELLLLREEQQHLRSCIAALPAQHREVLARNYFGEESLTAIAADMGLTLSRASQIRTRGLLLLRVALRHIWDGLTTEPVGGIRARREEEMFVGRAAERCRGSAA